MSNLLRRTTKKSNDKKQKSSKDNSVDIDISSLTNKMTQTINNEVYQATWEKYLHGERNIFTRQIYTDEGQKLFDEIKSKLDTNKKFKAEVSEFLSDFTKLLQKEVAKDVEKTQSYLFTDTGKVFTLLAHANGRLEGTASAI